MAVISHLLTHQQQEVEFIKELLTDIKELQDIIKNNIDKPEKQEQFFKRSVHLVGGTAHKVGRSGVAGINQMSGVLKIKMHSLNRKP